MNAALKWSLIVALGLVPMSVHFTMLRYAGDNYYLEFFARWLVSGIVFGAVTYAIIRLASAVKPAISNSSLNEGFSGEKGRVSMELSSERDDNDANQSLVNRIVGRKETRMIKRVDPFEEALYEQIAAELLAGQVKQGLWLKATVESGGNEHKTKSLYTQFRIAQILEETVPDVEAAKRRRSEVEAIERDRVIDHLRQHQYAVEEKELGVWVLYLPSGECKRFSSFAALADYAHDVLSRA